MKAFRYIGLIMLACTTCGAALAQEEIHESKIRIFLRSEIDPITPDEIIEIERGFNQFVEMLKEKQLKYKSDRAFLQYVFYQAHKRYLGVYEQYVTVEELFSDSRKYDCVTGTALYAVILDALGYSFEIRETDYHVFLLAKGENGSYLFESTDPIYGFASDPQEIDERIAIVIDDARRINEKLALTGVADQAGKAPGKATVIHNSIDLHELAGLHFYNQALKRLNEGNYREAFRQVTYAQGIYPSARIRNAASFIFAMAFED